MFKLKTNEDVRSAIRRRGAEIASQMTDQEIFTAPAFTKYATSLADFILRNHRLYALDIMYDNREEAPVAYTDGKKIFWNVGNTIAAHPRLLERRFKVNMGILFHEVAHKLFLDFQFSNRTLNKIAKGKLVGKFPSDPQYEEAIKELTTATANPMYSSSIAQIYANVANIIDDGHDEAAMKRCFPGFITECINTAGEVQVETSKSLRELVDLDWDAYSIYSSLFLHYAKFGTYKVGESNSFTEAYLEKMAGVKSVIDSALLYDNYKDRWDCINTLIIFLWPVLKKHFPEQPPQGNGSQSNSGSPQSGQQNGSGNSQGNSQGGSQQGAGGSQGSQNSQGGQSSGNGSQNGQQQNQSSENGSSGGQGNTAEQLQQMLQALAEAAQQATNSAPAPVNCKDKAVSEAAVQSGSPPPSGGGGLPQILAELTEKKAIESIQKELDQNQMDMIRNCNMPLIHTKVKTDFRRHIKPDKFAYDLIAKEIAPIARNLISQMLALFRELNEECIQRHKRFGPIIEATESYRPDRAFFAKKKLPEDYPDMAICILIDQSASMSRGGKIYHAQKTAILLEQFASGIGVPIMIAGHNTSGADCRITVYTDFATAKVQEDRYSLGGISSGGRNRDGLALRVCAEMLSKRPEQVKLMISISDGAPHHTNYAGKPAQKDISDAVNDYRRKGLLIYGAAIDKDEAIIKSIYGKGFLSIQNLAALPKTLVRLIRQQIV